MPLDTAGKDTDCQSRSDARVQAARSALVSLPSSSPSPKRGPMAWMTPLNGNLPAVVTTALPVGNGPRLLASRSDSSCSARPAAREMIAATPPPCARWPFAAFTIASTGSSSRLPRTTANTAPAAVVSVWSGGFVALLDLRLRAQALHQLLDARLHQVLLQTRLDLVE